MCKNATFLDLSFLLWVLHLLRNKHAQNNESTTLPVILTANLVTDSLIEESVKYVIQVIMKHGSLTNVVDRPIDYLIERGPVIGNILRKANHLYTLYTSISLLDLYQEYVRFDSNGKIIVDLNAAKNNPEISSLVDYFHRREMHTAAAKQPIRADQFVQSFVEDFSGIEDIFESIFGTSPSTFGTLITNLLDSVIKAFKSNETSLPTLPGGQINTAHPTTSILWGEALLISTVNLDNRFGQGASDALKSFLFEHNSFDPWNLEYHQVYRTPLLFYGQSKLIVSPELLLESLHLNMHYTLLEAVPAISDDYKSRVARRFVDQISSICAAFGYHEVDRELQIYDGTRHLGDVDLITRNTQGHYLLIEAKNHSLPLSVYFNNVSSTKKHLSYLQDNWGKQYHRRLVHLSNFSENYGISREFKYIIVSRMPEVLSHFFPYLAITKQELAKVLPNIQDINSFNDIFSQLYPPGEIFSDEDIANLVNDGLSVIKPV